MARWLLTEPHYLKVVDTFWEQSETDRTTGRQKKKKYPVPMHLDPDCAQDWNNKPGTSASHVSRGGNSWDQGFITVCYEGKGEPNDYVFVGDPTPGMEPIDEEAKAITAKFKWSKDTAFFDPSIGEMTFGERMILNMQEEIKVQRQEPSDKLDKVLDALALMMAENQKLIAALARRA